MLAIGKSLSEHFKPKSPMTDGPPVLQISSEVSQAKDFTYFIDLSLTNHAEFGKLHPKLPEDAPSGSPTDEENIHRWFARFDSWEGRLTIKGPTTKVTGRAMVAKCYDGKWLSVTIRRESEKAGDPYKRAASVTLPTKAGDNPWLPKAFNTNEPFAAGQFELGNELFKLLPRGDPPPHGLVVIAGTTGCSKSTVARHLLWQRLSELNSPNRRAHLVTLEDPIEDRLADTPTEAQKWEFDYTPRSLGRVRRQGDGERVNDCRNLAEGLRNALRMTPSAFYIGETRDKADWSEVLKFAGSGHFVVTTTHAGSLDETFQNILRAVGAVTPADRAAVADKLIAVVHLASLSIDIAWTSAPSKVSRPMTLPQLWRRMPNSAAGLVVDGLSSIQPVRADLKQAPSDMPCFARVSFVRPLLETCWPTITPEQLLEAELQVLQHELSCV